MKKEMFMKPEKTQTIRITPEIHKLAKSAAASEGLYLQVWIENLITETLKQEMKKSDV